MEPILELFKNTHRSRVWVVEGTVFTAEAKSGYPGSSTELRLMRKEAAVFVLKEIIYDFKRLNRREHFLGFQQKIRKGPTLEKRTWFVGNQKAVGIEDMDGRSEVSRVKTQKRRHIFFWKSDSFYEEIGMTIVLSLGRTELADWSEVRQFWVRNETVPSLSARSWKTRHDCRK